MEYARCVKNIDLGETLVVVVLNTPAYAGTTYFGYSEVGSRDFVEFAIAYCPVIYNLESETFRQVLVHEAIGHGFGKLLDEYAYEEQGIIREPCKALDGRRMSILLLNGMKCFGLRF